MDNFNNKSYADVLSEMKYFVFALIVGIVLFFMWIILSKGNKVAEIGPIKFESKEDSIRINASKPIVVPQNQTTIGTIKNATIINQPQKDVHI